MTDFTLRGSDSVVESSSTTGTVDAIAGTQKGDILFAHVLYGLSGAPTSTPTGWALVPGTTNHDVNDLDYCAIWYKIATDSEPANYTWEWAVANKITIGIYGFYGDVLLSDPFDVVSDTEYATANTIVRAASMSVSAVDSPLLWFGAAYDVALGDITVPVTGISFSSVSRKGSATSDLYSRCGYTVWASSGATGDMDGAVSPAEISKHAFAIALNVGYSLEEPTYSVTGGEFETALETRVDCECGVYSITGGELDTFYSMLDLDGGVYSLAGLDVDAVHYVAELDLDGGSYSTTGGEFDVLGQTSLESGVYTITGLNVVEDINVEYTERLNNYLLTASLHDRIEDLVRIPKLVMGDSDQILDKLLNRRHLGDASGVWLAIDGDIVGVERPLEEIPDDEYFEFGETYVGVPPVYSNGFADTDQLTGGRLRGLYGTWLDGVTYVADADYETLIEAKAYATFKGSTLKTLIDYIKNAFGVTASVYIDSSSDWHVVLDEYLSTKHRRYLLQYAPVPAGSDIVIDNWPEETP